MSGRRRNEITAERVWPDLKGLKPRDFRTMEPATLDDARESLDGAIFWFMTERCVAQDAADWTLHWYRQHLGSLRRWLKDSKVTRVQDVDSSHIRQWFAREAKRVKPMAANSSLRAVRAFFNALVNEEIIPRSPARTVKLLRVWEEPPQTLTPEEAQKLISVWDKRDVLERRNATILELLLETGIRANELCWIGLDDIRWGEGLLYIRREGAKGKKPRWVPISRLAQDKLQGWITRRNRWVSRLGWDTPWLFPSSYGGGRLRPSSINAFVREAFRRAGIPTEGRKHGSHLLRHTSAHSLVMANVDIRRIAQILGHEQLGTTVRYTQLLRGELTEGWDEISPLARLSGRR